MLAQGVKQLTVDVESSGAQRTLFDRQMPKLLWRNLQFSCHPFEWQWLGISAKSLSCNKRPKMLASEGERHRYVHQSGRLVRHHYATACQGVPGGSTRRAWREAEITIVLSRPRRAVHKLPYWLWVVTRPQHFAIAIG